MLPKIITFLQTNRPLVRRMIAFGVLTLGCFSILWAQDDGEVSQMLRKNLLLTEQLGILGPIAISPYWGLALASGASLFGVAENEFLTTHPMLGNWIVFVLFIIAAIITSVPNISKFSKALGVAANYLEDNTSIIIVILAMVLPYLGFASGSTPEGLKEFAILGISFKTIFMIAMTAFYMFIVTTVRLFFEVIVFITPIPAVDTVMEIAKKVTCLGLMIIYFISPETAMVISGVILLISIFFFRRANRSIHYFKHFYIRPIMSWVSDREPELIDAGLSQKIQNEYSSIDLAIPVYPMHKFGKIPKKKKAWLVEAGDGVLYLCRDRFWRRPIIEMVSKGDVFNGLKLEQQLNFLVVSSNHEMMEGKFKIRINREYFSKREEIAKICKITYVPKESNQDIKSWWGKIRNFFSSKQVATDAEVRG